MNSVIFMLHTALVTSSLLVATRHSKGALVACITLLCVLSNIFVLKEISLFGFQATPTDALAIGTMLGLSLMQEYYGKAAARQTIIISFAVGFLYTLLTLFQRAYIPCETDTAHAHFMYLLTPMPRIMLASLVSYAISQYVDYAVFAQLKNYTHGRFFAVRLYGAAIISQLVDTLLFTFLGLYGVVTSISGIIVISYSIKLLCTFLGGMFIIASRRMLQQPASSSLH
jgi:uncharacterized integral membrane protein (TIGR00697 family)